MADGIFFVLMLCLLGGVSAWAYHGLITLYGLEASIRDEPTLPWEEHCKRVREDCTLHRWRKRWRN